MNLSWNLNQLYPNFESREYLEDKEFVRQQLEKRPTEKQDLSSFKSLILDLNKTNLILESLYVYCVAVTSLNTQDEKARAEYASVRSLHATLTAAILEARYQACELSVTEWDKLFSDPQMLPLKSGFEIFKKNKSNLLDSESEKLISKLYQFGPDAFSSLYQDVSGKILLELDFVPGKKLSKAEAFNYLFHHDGEYRKKAWQAISAAMEANKESFSAILNSIYGHRVEVAKLRNQFNNKNSQDSFLDQSLRQAKISKKTLDAMMSAIASQQSWLREILQVMGKVLNKGKLNAWDLLAPSPSQSEKKVEINQALEIIKNSFSPWSDDFTVFLKEMVDKNLIDSNVTSTRIGGAFQMYFPKKKLPMVFLTYDGTFPNVMTLAHELGHAYHSYLQKDLNISELDNPNTLAETASVFAEFCLNDYMLSTSQDTEEKKKALWESASRAIAFLVNIPARYEFEKLANEKRASSYISASEFCNLTEQAWKKWYGDSINQYESYFWAQKMHFSLSNVDFYNYPYAFGYLFSATLYSELKKQGPSFMKVYKEILKNTGKMTAEELVSTFLDKDISKEEFWLGGLELIKSQMEQFRKAWI